jgi:hypothetical protein
LPPTTLLTTRVAAEAKNSTPIVAHDFQRNSLSYVVQIMDNDRAAPTAMQMMQIVKQTLFSNCQLFMETSRRA